MVIGEITGIVFDTVCAKNHKLYGRPELALELIMDEMVMENINVECKVLVAQITNTIGYIAGTFPPEIGNKILQYFQAKHPYFGDTIPDNLEDSLKWGIRAGEMIAAEKKAAREKELGVKIPEIDETVSDDLASSMLAKLREMELKRKGIVNSSTKEKSPEKIAKTLAPHSTYDPSFSAYSLSMPNPYEDDDDDLSGMMTSRLKD